MLKKDLFYMAYKPLRNHLRKLAIDESLLVIWSYAAYLHGRNPSFEQIEVLKEYLEANPIQKRIWMSEWELELLTREVILNSDENPYPLKTLRKNSFLVSAINKIKDIDGKIAELYINPENVLIELHRLGHREFPWQIKNPSTEYFTRYYKIFSEPTLAKLVNDSIGVSIKEFYLIASLLWGYFLDNVALNYPPKIEVEGVTLEKLNNFIEHLSCTLNECKEKILSSHQLNEKFNYSPYIGRYFPILKMNYFGIESLVCIDSTLFFWRVTDGLYYEINKMPGFSDAFGPSFQSYVGEVLSKACKRLKYFKERSYGSKHNMKDSIDWIVEDRKCLLFVECKTKRMREDSKVELLDESKLNLDLDKMAESIVQTYCNIKEYEQNKYPHFAFRKDKKIMPMVVTLENWILHGDTITRLDKFVEARMIKKNLPLKWLHDRPYSVCAIEEFESFIQIAEKKGICKVLEGKVFDLKERQWTMDNYLRKNFKKEKKLIKFLFDDDFKKILPKKAYE